MKRPLHILGNERGVTLMIVLVMVVITGLAAGIAGSSWKTTMQRAREKELLWRGDQYRKAIGSYSRIKHGGTQGLFPNRFEDLLLDSRSGAPLRHIRKLYVDPMTGGDWVLIKDEGGRIKGVHSSSVLQPFKAKGFAEELKDFDGVESYREWEFIYRPPKKSTPKKPQAKKSGT